MLPPMQNTQPEPIPDDIIYESFRGGGKTNAVFAATFPELYPLYLKLTEGNEPADALALVAAEQKRERRRGKMRARGRA